MKTLDKALTASVFSLGKYAPSAAEALLPADALVIVIQDGSGKSEVPPLPQWNRYEVPEIESLPIIRRRAEKAYSGSAELSVPGINVSV
jgi:hypothetical protein